MRLCSPYTNWVIVWTFTSRSLASSVACARSSVDTDQRLRGENPRESWPVRVGVRPLQPNHSIGAAPNPKQGRLTPWRHVYVGRYHCLQSVGPWGAEDACRGRARAPATPARGRDISRPARTAVGAAA